MRSERLLQNEFARFGFSVAIVGVVTLLLVLIRDDINSTTEALVLLLAVLVTATFFGRNAALLSAFAAMLSFNYFFIPPVHTWQIADSQNLVAWAAFTLTALIGGELSTYARRRAKEAQRLYDELQEAFETATQAEALKQSEKLKSALLDAVTHDLRTPLTSIKASVTTLLDSEGGHRTIELDSGGRAEFLNIIDEETDRLNRFIEGIIEIARVEAGTSPGAASAAELEEIISATIFRAKPLIGSRHLVTDLEADLPLLRVNDRAIGEVLYNLIDNAAKFSPPDSTITVSGVSHGNKVIVTVEDEGPGIPSDIREHVFRKFYRADGKTEGLGLGLAIARGIVESQSGEIRIDENEGRGTKMVIVLPIVQDE